MPGPCRVQTPVPPSTTSHCHGFQKDGSAGAALRAGLRGGDPHLFSLHLVILPIIMERLEKFPFMQVSPHFSSQFSSGSCGAPALLPSCLGAGD